MRAEFRLIHTHTHTHNTHARTHARIQARTLTSVCSMKREHEVQALREMLSKVRVRENRFSHLFTSTI
jgi:hypothetical protein